MSARIGLRLRGRLVNDQCTMRGARGARCRRNATALFIREPISGYGRSSWCLCDSCALRIMREWRIAITPVNERSRELMERVSKERP